MISQEVLQQLFDKLNTDLPRYMKSILEEMYPNGSEEEYAGIIITLLSQTVIGLYKLYANLDMELVEISYE